MKLIFLQNKVVFILIIKFLKQEKLAISKSRIIISAIYFVIVITSLKNGFSHILENLYNPTIYEKSIRHFELVSTDLETASNFLNFFYF